MSTDTNKAIVRRYYEELWNGWQLDLAEELIAGDIRFRGSLGVQGEGREGFKQYVTRVRAAFLAFSETWVRRQRSLRKSCGPQDFNRHLLRLLDS